MAISAKLVKELRERTGLGMMDCKKALEEAGGDIDLAIEELRKRSVLKAAKKAGRTTADGLLGVRIADDGKRAAMVEVNIETDFAAKNEKFIAFVARVLNQVFEAGNEDIGSLLATGLDTEREKLVQEIGENISVRRATFFQTDGFIASYIHTDKRKGTLIELTAANADLGKDLAMHVTAHDPVPLVVASQDLDRAIVAKEREIFVSQAAESGKPPEIVEKMVEGRVRKYLAEVSLVDQGFVKDPSQKVSALLSDAGVEVGRFVRFEVGEGIEVEEEDFAAEVAQQIKDAK
ncbi:MAG: translation elongation factor Ts [Pseudomonadales bacterium]|jgi:elongation factor Ts|nr:translation elongation factor Ts [Pseudomonadales bacterium]MDP6970049.1 translation elongation factor Ts [Pseudomonadales bacterium]|tara:strand:+ start:165 stop:1037 length:873 start_codon:yes stop_codon:yes gene_type:complete